MPWSSCDRFWRFWILRILWKWRLRKVSMPVMLLQFCQSLALMRLKGVIVCLLNIWFCWTLFSIFLCWIELVLLLMGFYSQVLLSCRFHSWYFWRLWLFGFHYLLCFLSSWLWSFLCRRLLCFWFSLLSDLIRGFMFCFNSTFSSWQTTFSITIKYYFLTLHSRIKHCLAFWWRVSEFWWEFSFMFLTGFWEWIL